MSSLLIDVISFSALKSFQQLLRIFPEEVKKEIGKILGLFAYSVLRERRNVAFSNMKWVFRDVPDLQIKKRVKRVFENLGINAVECLSFPYLKESEYGERFSIEIEDNAKDVVEREGFLALVFHFANWEIMGVASKLLKREIVALARPLKGYRFINRLINELRFETGLTVLPYRDNLQRVMRLIREKKIVAILADQRERRSKCVQVEFFGDKVPTTKSIAIIALRTGAPVIPVYLVRKGFLNYSFIFCNPIEIEREGNLTELVYKNTKKINSFLEFLITKYPEEWFWVHRRWKRKGGY